MKPKATVPIHKLIKWNTRRYLRQMSSRIREANLIYWTIITIKTPRRKEKKMRIGFMALETKGAI